MASEIQIQGPLRFIGYVQDNKAGTNSQVLTYSEGNAVWADVPDSEDAEYNKIITTADTRDVMINRFGDVLTNELTTYTGINVGTELEAAAEILGLPVISYHHLEYNFSTGQLEERYAEDNETIAIDYDLTYIVGFIRNEFELLSNGNLVYLG